MDGQGSVPVLGVSDLRLGDVLLFQWGGLDDVTKLYQKSSKPVPEDLSFKNCLYSLISGLDGTPYVHAAVVVETDPSVKVADSIHESAIVDLTERCRPYGARDVLVRRHPLDVGAAVARSAETLAKERRGYPNPDLVLGAVALRLARYAPGVAGSGALAEEIAARLRKEEEKPGWVCGAFVDAAFARAGHPLSEPDRTFPAVPALPDECRKKLCPLIKDQARLLFPSASDELLDALAEFALDGRVDFWQVLRGELGPLMRGRSAIRRAIRGVHHPRLADFPSLMPPGEVAQTTSLTTKGRLSGWC